MSFLKKIFGNSNDAKDSDQSEEANELVLNSLPIDEQFTHQFKKNGGKFIYCENLMEVKEQFENILEENDWFECEALCFEEKLHSLLEENKIIFKEIKNPVFFFSTCENLIANEGAVLFSSNQIKEIKPNELPTNMVVLATTSQISLSKSDALQAVRKKYITNYPSNFTAIKYFNQTIEQDFMTYGNNPKNFYLLLLEDL